MLEKEKTNKKKIEKKHFCRTSRVVYKLHARNARARVHPRRAAAVNSGGGTRRSLQGSYTAISIPSFLFFPPFTDPPGPPHPVFVCSFATGFLRTVRRLYARPSPRTARTSSPAGTGVPVHTQPFVPTGKSRTVLPFASAIFPSSRTELILYCSSVS